MAAEIQTNLGPILLPTTYLPPRRPFLPFTDMHRLLSNSITTYIIGDFNGRHTSFGNTDCYTVGKSLINLVDRGKMIHLGPHFSTFYTHNSTTNPDKIFANKHHYLSFTCEPGEVTSDHLPIIFKLSSIPFIKEKPKMYKTHQADWAILKSFTDSHNRLDSRLIT